MIKRGTEFEKLSLSSREPEEEENQAFAGDSDRENGKSLARHRETKE